MSKNKENNVNQENEDLELQKINADKNQKDDSTFEKFCEKYCEDNFNKEFQNFPLEKLQQSYEELNTYVIMYDLECKNSEYNNRLVYKMQFILSKIAYAKASVEAKNTLLEMEKIKEDINDTYNSVKKVDAKNAKTFGEVKHIKNDIKSIITVFISVIITISIIPTALSGIDKIDPNYILPFISAIILFGLIIITFVYTIYQDKLKSISLIILLSVIIMTIFLFVFSYNVSISKEIEINNSINEK